MSAIKFEKVTAGQVVESSGRDQFVHGKFVAQAVVDGRHYLQLVDENGEVHVFDKGVNFKFDLVGGAEYTMRAYYGLKKTADGDVMGRCYQQLPGNRPIEDFIAIEYKG